MTPSSQRRAVLRAALGLPGLLIGAPFRAAAHEYYVPYIRISHPWCRATPQSAGSAIVCMTFDEVTRDDRLIGVETPVAERAETGGPGGGPTLDVAVPAARDTVLGEDGPHVRLVGLTQDLELGRSYPLRLVFALGGSVQATLDVAYDRMPSKKFVSAVGANPPDASSIHRPC